MFGRVRGTGESECHADPDDLKQRERRQYLAILQYLHEHELLETMATLEHECGLSFTEGSLPVASVLESSLDMFSDYFDKVSKNSDVAQTDEEVLLAIENGICCTSQSTLGPCESLGANVIAVAWASLHAEEFIILVSTADRRVRVLGSHGEFLTDLAELPSPVLSLDVASLPISATNQADDLCTRSQEVLATTMGGETLLLKLERLPSLSWSLHLVKKYKDHAKHASCGRFSLLGESCPASTHFVTVSRDHTAVVYTRSGDESSTFVRAGSATFPGEVTCCCWVSSSIFVVAARDDYHLHYWDAGADKGPAEHLKVSLNVLQDGIVSFTVLAVAVSPDRELIAACTDKSRVIVLKVLGTTQLRNLYGAVVDDYDMPSVCFSLDRSFIYTTSSISVRAVASRVEQQGLNEDIEDAACGEVAIFELRTGQLALRLPCHKRSVRCMSRHPHTEALITGSFDKEVKIWT